MSISLMSSVNLWCLDIFNTTPLKKEEICWCWHVFHWRPNNFLHYLNNFFSWWSFLIMACDINHCVKIIQDIRSISPYSGRMRSRKLRTRKTSYLNTFHALYNLFFIIFIYILHSSKFWKSSWVTTCDQVLQIEFMLPQFLCYKLSLAGVALLYSSAWWVGFFSKTWST